MEVYGEGMVYKLGFWSFVSFFARLVSRVCDLGFSDLSILS